MRGRDTNPFFTTPHFNGHRSVLLRGQPDRGAGRPTSSPRSCTTRGWRGPAYARGRPGSPTAASPTDRVMPEPDARRAVPMTTRKIATVRPSGRRAPRPGQALRPRPARAPPCKLPGGHYRTDRGCRAQPSNDCGGAGLPLVGRLVGVGAGHPPGSVLERTEPEVGVEPVRVGRGQQRAVDAHPAQDLLGLGEQQSADAFSATGRVDVHVADPRERRPVGDDAQQADLLETVSRLGVGADVDRVPQAALDRRERPAARPVGVVGQPVVDALDVAAGGRRWRR